MKIKLPITKVRLNQLFLHLSAWFERHWIKVLAIVFCSYLALERDLSIQLQLSTQYPSVKITNGNTLSRSATAAPVKLTSFKKVKNDDATIKKLKYVERFSKVAQVEMDKFGIPASITLAQGLLESQAGQSSLALKNNNHFGIKCFSKNCQKGHCRNFQDDSHKDFFRVYPSAWESYRAHSLLLKRKTRYKELFEYAISDYQNWAKGLSKLGYATDPNYADKLIQLIEGLALYEYDSTV